MTLIEAFVDPVTKKKTSRTVKAYGFIEDKLKEDPEFLKKVYAERDRLRNDRDAKEHLRSEVERKIYPDLDGRECGNCYASAPRLMYGDAAIRAVWEKLGLDKWFKKTRHNAKLPYDLDLAAFYMVACRIMTPSSRRRMMRDAPMFLFNYSGNLTFEQLYDTLGQVSKRKKTLTRYLTGSVDRLVERDASLFFYDVTTFYFESFTPDGLRERGMSKEHRTHETQVVLGMLIDRSGIPLNYELFPGNAAETGTLMKVVDEYRKAKPGGRVIVVADRGLNSKSNLSELRKCGCQYIVAHSLHRLRKAQRDWLFSEEGWRETFDAETGEMIKKFKSMPLPKAQEVDCQDVPACDEDRAPGNGDEAGKPDVRLVVSWSSRRFHNDMKELDAQWQQAKKLVAAGKGMLNSSFRRGCRQFLKTGKENSYELHVQLYERKKLFAGYYGFATSCQDLSDESVYGMLRELWRIEENFSVMKTLLQSRPVYVRTQEHIRGHFVLCVVALTIERIMHKRLRESGEDCSFEYMTELLTTPTVSPILTSRNKVPLYLKTSWFINKNPEGAEPFECDMGDDAARIMGVFGIKPIRTLETLVDMRERLGVNLPLAPRAG